MFVSGYKPSTRMQLKWPVAEITLWERILSTVANLQPDVGNKSHPHTRGERGRETEFELELENFILQGL